MEPKEIVKKNELLFGGSYTTKYIRNVSPPLAF